MLGQDIIFNQDSGSGVSDVLSLGQDIAADQLWFRRVGSDLEISVIGTDDRVTISSWYTSGAYQLDQIVTSSGQVLLANEVQNLVSAMASFSPPASGQTTLPQNYQEALAGVIASNW